MKNNFPAIINYFANEWAFLSNFYPCPIILDGIAFSSVEHAYQAAKTLDFKRREIFSVTFNPNLRAGQAKRIGRNLPLRPDWEEVKLNVMRDLLIQKFTPSILRRKLIATFNAELIEGNWWHDVRWGTCYGEFQGRTCREYPHEPVGLNHLGNLLMEVRSSVTGLQK